MPEPESEAESFVDAARVLSTILDGSSEALAVIAGGVVRRASRPMAALLGYPSPEALEGVSLGALFAPDDAAALGDTREAEGAPARLTARRANGETLPVEGTVMGTDGARVIRLRDVGARPEDALYRAMFEVNSAVKLLIDPRDGRIIDANPAAAELYGWSLDELRSMRVTDINTMAPDAVEEEMERARTTKRTYFRFEHRTARGDLRHVEVHSGPVRIEGHDLLLSIVHDVTERDAFEEALRTTQRFETVGRLAGGVAHDFNNLLMIMSTSCGLIGRHVPDDSPAQPLLSDLGDSIRRASALTRQLLTLGSRQVMRRQTVELPALIRGMERLWRQTLGARIALSIEIEDTPPVLADPGQLEQVILNLVLNARDAMPAGGSLVIRTGAREVGLEGAPGLATGRYAVMTVEDSGQGIDEATRAKIFDPFFTTRRDKGGTGLGLSMVYGIVTQSGGHVGVRSELGRGTAFDVHLPESTEPLEEPAAPEQGVSAVASSQGERPIVALVEDSEHVRRVLAQSLEAFGFTVSPFVSGDDALACSDDELASFAAVVSDVVMPGSSGIEVSRVVRRRRPELPIVLISGDVSEHGEAGLPPDIVFLQKPFGVEELVRTLRDAIGASATAP